MKKLNPLFHISAMQKLLSLVLCFSIVCTSVTPALGQAAAAGRTARSLAQVGKTTRISNRALTGAVSRRMALNNAFTNSLLQQRVLAGEIAGQADFILRAPATQRSTMLRHDFVGLSFVSQAVSPMQRAEALSFYQQNLKNNTAALRVADTSLPHFLQTVHENPSYAAGQAAGEVLADASALALLGTREQAPALVAFYQQARGTVFEETVTVITARGLLRMQAYDELSALLAQTDHPEALAGLSAYIQEEHLPVEIPDRFSGLSASGTVNPQLSQFLQRSFPLGDLAADPSLEATRLWMGLEQLTPQTAQQGAKVAARGASMPQHPVEQPVRTDGATSVAQTVLSNQPVLHPDVEEVLPHAGQVQQSVGSPAAAARVPETPADGIATTETPRWIEVETTNALGNTVKTWQPNPDHPDYAQLVAQQQGTFASGKQPGWLEKARLNWALNWKPAFQRAFNFGSSRYGLAALGPGAAPLSSEAVVAAADMPAAVQTVRAQQGAFVSDEVLRGGAGATYRTGAVNPGGVAAQQFAHEGVAATRPQGQMPRVSVEPAIPMQPATPVGMGYATVPLRPTVGSQVAFAGTPASGVLYSSLFPISPRLIQNAKNWITNTLQTRKNTAAANKLAEMVLSKPHPLAFQLRDIVLNSQVSVSYRKQSLLRLYEQGALSKFLNEQSPAVKEKVTQAATDEQRTEALFRLYQAGYLDPVLQAIADVQEQGSVLSELQNIVSQDDWRELARSAYEVEAVLPLQTENFMGSVSPVPEPDLDKIKDLVRPSGYAVANSSQGTATGKGIYYENNIPFYYRNSKGDVSSEPVGILTQIPSGRYGRFLSSMHLANQPGFTIPEGFVLALDEQGQWKFVVPKGNLATVETNPSSRKKLAKMQKDGSFRAVLDTNYTTSDLLAMAHLLEHNPERNLELTLNTPHSLSRFLFLHALFVGNDAGNTLTGPFKETATKTFKAVAGFVTNLLSGIGYLTPIAGGYAMPTMKKWGNVKTTQVIYGASALALAGSLALGMHGFGKEAPALPLLALAVPTVALVLGASLINSFVPYFLNFYKDPAQRTAANLEFDTRKQLSRMSLSAITAGAIALGGNWTVVVPIGLALLGISYAMFINTPMYKGEVARKADEAKEAREEQERFAKLSPEEQKKELDAKEAAKQNEKELQARFVEEYKAFRDTHSEMIASKGRVKKVYAAYAASLMILGQSAAEAFGKGAGQGFITACMAATLGTRLLSTYLVKTNKVTDDQLTGLSLPTMALTALALGLIPYSGIAAGAAGVAAILHYMSTAVPGRLDAARMQNIVTAEMQQRKQQVLDNESLTPAQKKEQVTLLTKEESTWSAAASKDYSFYNAHGLAGIGIAALAALGLSDLGPQAIKDVLTQAFSWTGSNSVSLAVNRLLFLYAGGVAGWAYLTNRDLTREGLRLLKKKTAITAQNIREEKVTPKLLGINEKNAQIQLGNVTNKRMKDVEPLLVEYGISSEQKMTNILQQLQVIHNRLVAISQILGTTATRAAFEREAGMVRKYATIIGQNDLSVMLRREFDKLQTGLFETGTQQVKQTPGYVEEGVYELPDNYTSYESARMLGKEIDQMAYNLRQGKQIDYAKFAEYLTRAREELLEYEKANPADSVRVMVQRRKLNNVCVLLAKEDHSKGLLDVLDTDSQQIQRGKQAMRDLLAGYLE